MKISQTWMVVALGTVVAVGLTGCRNGGEVFAVVNGERISMSDFTDHLQTKPTVTVGIGNGQVAELEVADTLAWQAAQDLIARTVLLQLAAEEGVMPTEAEINQEVEIRRTLNPNFITNLQNRGLSMGSIKDNLRIDLARERLITKGITVTDEELERFISDNRERFIEPATVDLQFILAGSDEVRQTAQRALDAGQPFLEVARAHSQDPEIESRQGRFTPGPVPVNALPPAIGQAINGLPPTTSSDWIDAGDGTQVKFYVVSRTEERPIDMNENRRTWLRRQMAIERGMQATDLNRRLAERLASSDVSMELSSLRNRWNQFSERLQDQAGDVDVLPTTEGEAGAAG